MKKLNIAKNRLYVRNLASVTHTQLNFSGTNIVKCRNQDGLAYVTEGGCDYFFDDGTQFTAKAGDILYLADQSSYRMVLTSPSYTVIFFNLLFETDALRQSAVYAPSPSHGAENLFRRLLRAYRSVEESWLCECMSYVYRILGIITSLENSTYTGRSAREKMADAKDYIDRNYEDLALSVSSLAASAEMSEVYFRRLFRLAFGITPTQYILSVRLSRAKELLADGGIGLTECARLSGFSSPQYFCRVFKEKFGITPAKYGRSKKG